MKGSVKSALSTFFLVLLAAAVVVGVYLAYLKVNGKALPFASLFARSETEVISDEAVEEQLLSIGELSTASFEYTNTRTVSDTRRLFGKDIPGTANKVTVTYEGVIKVSYDLEEIVFETDSENGVIRVTLPEARITDNYIKFDSIDIESKNNLLNPINIENLADYFGDFQDEAIGKAEEMDIWAEAEDRMMLLVEKFLGQFPGYVVEFTE